ncbi:MAG TPA: CPBP family intramembrane glutamic endopeptidase [Acidobacteriaceae bacterium]|nr:CPBP family intramembrane glutamic endopeptidase [Acidobacteriaceae bacterium]
MAATSAGPVPLISAEPFAALAAEPRGKLLEFPARPVPAAVPGIHALLLGEFLLLFAILPMAVFFHAAVGLDPLQPLWLATGVCLVLLLADPTFDRRQLWNGAPLGGQLPQILGLFAAGAVAITALVHEYAPQLLFSLPRHHPQAWALVILSYPFVSVIPQTLVYRVFLFHRYRALLPSNPRTQSAALILLSASAFAFSHIVFHNWIAVALTVPGGVLFAVRYNNTRSLCVSLVEHALYGCFLFTIGLGVYFGLR